MAPHKTPMTRLTTAPTTPTSSEICAPYMTREKTSRPCMSVPNQCCASGGRNCASDRWSGSWIWAKAAPAGPQCSAILRATGHATTRTSSKARYQALMTAGRFLLESLPGLFAGRGKSRVVAGRESRVESRGQNSFGRARFRRSTLDFRHSTVFVIHISPAGRARCRQNPPPDSAR